MSLRSLTSVAVAALALMGSANAAQISSLFNTGVDNSGTVLPNGTIGDPHYSLISVPAGTTDLRVVTSANGFPVGPWLGDNSLSRWVGPNNDTSLTGNPGVYIYRTTFNITGPDVGSARISGRWSTDNSGVDIVINGTPLGYTTDAVQFSLGFSPFYISTGLVEGLNTLDFWVRNTTEIATPTGLRVEMVGTVPEPGSLALAGLALTGLALTRRRTR